MLRAPLVAVTLCTVVRSATAGVPPPGTEEPAPGPRPAQVTPAEPTDDALTTATWEEPRVPLDLHWHLLALPEYLVELLIAPIAYAVGTVEYYRLDQRVYDLLRNDAGTIKIAPSVKFTGADGLGGGAALEFDDLFKHEEEFEVGGLVRLNTDWKARTRYRQPVARFEGRVVTGQVELERNQNLKFYGVGNDSAPEDERVIREERLDTFTSIDLFHQGTFDWGGALEVGYRRVKLGPGKEMGLTPLGEPGDTVETTGDFGRTSQYGTAGVSLRYDTRDTAGRTTKGMLAEATSRVSAGVDKANLGAGDGQLSMTGYVPVAPMFRVLVGRVGVAGVVPLTTGDQVPLDDLVTLDRKHGLRGYSSGRFRDRLAWWAGAEYRWMIYEYQNSGVGLSPGVFFDFGRVGDQVEELCCQDIHWGTGLVLRGEHQTKGLFEIELGYSPEGYDFNFGAGKDF